MVKVSYLWLFLISITFTSSALADELEDFAVKNPTLFCMVDTSGEQYDFHCHDANLGESFVNRIPPIMSGEFSASLRDRGVEIVTAEEFIARTFPISLASISEGPTACETCLEREYRSGFKIKEFNRLDPTGSVIQHLRRLAQALHSAGVCDLGVKRENYNSIDVRSSDDLLQQFLCISNSESTFGGVNIGQGGRGPWGIHPMHNLAKGKYIPGSKPKRKMDKNGICYGSRAIVRDANGKEIKSSDAYRDPAVIADNAACAIKIYEGGSPNGFRSWGTGEEWGSNRHCSKLERNKFDFERYLGELACCSEACRARIAKEDLL